MNGSNHSMNDFSTYPFKIFGGKWSETQMNTINKGNTIIGNDVWIGNRVTIMPGIKIGHGAIIGTNSLITKNVAPYTIVGGNPAKEIRKRFDEETTQLLLSLQWWNWEIEKITDNLETISNGNTHELKKLLSNIK